MANRLANESSPYLLQHRDNPVDWYPWGSEALSKARSEDKPIFLSIGYSACHWCHVMEHESFEDSEIAALLNEGFVAIKVDREERPDLDQIYMNAVQLLTGRGGWPMSVFLTPERKPFFGGTYWPARAKMGMPGFMQVLEAVLDAWRNRRPQALAQADELTQHLTQLAPPASGGQPLSLEVLQHAVARLEQSFDARYGGFGGAPKFPHATDLQVLLRYWHRHPRDGVLQMVETTLDHMARGGIYDHLAGGFARYSTDERWLVPHFEKMLYDNALLTDAYLDAFQATGQPSYAQVARETLDYVLSYLTDSQGAFHSTEDADSEGREGAFYVWTVEQIHSVLGSERGERFCYVYDVQTDGNWEGESILNLPKTVDQCAALRNWDHGSLIAELRESREQLRQVRDQRVRPGKDDKVLTSWNGLMIEAMARGGAILQDPKYLQAAGQAARFILTKMRQPNGRLWHMWRQGKVAQNAFLDDYAYLANALVTLYETDFDRYWLDQAESLAQIMIEHFQDADGGGFFYTSDDHEQLITRNKDLYDASIPSGNAMAATVLVRLAKLTGREDYRQTAERTLGLAAGVLAQSPTAAAQMLVAADLLWGPTPEIVLCPGADAGALEHVLAELHRRFLPNRVLALCDPSTDDQGSLQPLCGGKQAVDGQVTMYVCQDFACQQPQVGPESIARYWDDRQPTSNP